MNSVFRDPKFSILRALVDILGFAIGSFCLVWVSFSSKQLSDETAYFSFFEVAVVFSIFLTAYLMTAVFYGNRTALGLKALLLSSLLGTLIYICGSFLLLLLTQGVDSLNSLSLGMSVFVFISLGLVSFLIAFAVRLLLTPVILSVERYSLDKQKQYK